MDRTEEATLYAAIKRVQKEVGLSNADIMDPPVPGGLAESFQLLLMAMDPNSGWQEAAGEVVLRLAEEYEREEVAMHNI